MKIGQFAYAIFTNEDDDNESCVVHGRVVSFDEETVSIQHWDGEKSGIAFFKVRDVFKTALEAREELKLRQMLN